MRSHRHPGAHVYVNVVLRLGGVPDDGVDSRPNSRRSVQHCLVLGAFVALHELGPVLGFETGPVVPPDLDEVRIADVREPLLRSRLSEGTVQLLMIKCECVVGTKRRKRVNMLPGSGGSPQEM